MKNRIEFSLVALFLFLAGIVYYSCSPQPTKAAETNITAQFKVVSYSQGQYEAVNVHNSQSKPRLFFTQSDVKNSHYVSVGSIITGYYKPLKGEDQFLYVK